MINLSDLPKNLLGSDNQRQSLDVHNNPKEVAEFRVNVLQGAVFSLTEARNTQATRHQGANHLTATAIGQTVGIVNTPTAAVVPPSAEVVNYAVAQQAPATLTPLEAASQAAYEMAIPGNQTYQNLGDGELRAQKTT